MDTQENHILNQTNKHHTHRTQNQKSELGITSENRKKPQEQSQGISICRTEVLGETKEDQEALK